MPRTDVPITKPALFGGALTDIKALATAGDSANDHEFLNTGKQMFMVFNDSGGPIVATAKGVANTNTFNRSSDTVITVAAGEVGIFNFLNPTGFNQADGTAQIDLDSSASVSVLALELAQ